MGHSILGMPFYGNKKLPLSKSIYEGGSGYETMLSAQKIEFSDGLGGGITINKYSYLYGILLTIHIAQVKRVHLPARIWIKEPTIIIPNTMRI